jgi:hypothetical protein
LCYDLRPRGIPGNPRGVIYTKTPKTVGKNSMEATPKYVSDLLSLMRRVWNPDTDEFLINEDWIADARAPDPIAPSEVRDALDATDQIAGYLAELQLTRQRGQKVYLELHCEAADLRQRIARVARPYGVTVFSGGGFDGLKPKKEAAERAAGRSVPTIVGQITDYDKRGKEISVDYDEDVRAWVEFHRKFFACDGSIEVRRLALIETQAIEHDLLDADGKAEADGIPVPVLDEIVRSFIESNLDADIAWRVVKAERKMHKSAWRLIQSSKIKRVRMTPQVKRDGDWSWARGGRE